VDVFIQMREMGCLHGGSRQRVSVSIQRQHVLPEESTRRRTRQHMRPRPACVSSSSAPASLSAPASSSARHSSARASRSSPPPARCNLCRDDDLGTSPRPRQSGERVHGVQHITRSRAGGVCIHRRISNLVLRRQTRVPGGIDIDNGSRQLHRTVSPPSVAGMMTPSRSRQRRANTAPMTVRSITAEGAYEVRSDGHMNAGAVARGDKRLTPT
jgi:hypothetical protein